MQGGLNDAKKSPFRNKQSVLNDLIKNWTNWLKTSRSFNKALEQWRIQVTDHSSFKCMLN